VASRPTSSPRRLLPPECGIRQSLEKEVIYKASRAQYAKGHGPHDGYRHVGHNSLMTAKLERPLRQEKERGLLAPAPGKRSVPPISA
jgi:hypothetical protein